MGSQLRVAEFPRIRGFGEGGVVGVTARILGNSATFARNAPLRRQMAGTRLDSGRTTLARTATGRPVRLSWRDTSPAGRCFIAALVTVPPQSLFTRAPAVGYHDVRRECSRPCLGPSCGARNADLDGRIWCPQGQFEPGGKSVSRRCVDDAIPLDLRPTGDNQSPPSDLSSCTRPISGSDGRPRSARLAVWGDQGMNGPLMTVLHT
jgi:hypothetical protein